MALGYDGKLFILAFDHRGSFQKKMFGIEGAPSAAQAEEIRDAKSVIFDGYVAAIEQGTSGEDAGLLVDEEFGADVARTARDKGWTLAMPVERSGMNWFDFEYGQDFGAHVETFDPNFSKILLRYNPEGDADENAKSVANMVTLSDWLHANDRRFLLELLVPATPSQLEAVGGSDETYDTDVRPGLMAAAIRAIQDAGIEADIWKIEGIDRREDCEMISAVARRDGRDGVACVVLGRGADDAKVEHWLRQGSGVPGYIGFAIGRTIWWDQLKGYVKGTLDRTAAAAQIATNYRHFVDVYENG